MASRSATRPFGRRRFLAGAALGALAAPAAIGAGAAQPSDRVRMGFIGVGGRGTTHLRTLLGHGAADVTWICDIDDERRAAGARLVREKSGKEPQQSPDHRRVLDAKDVDAVLIAVPCDVHAPLYLDTIAAGKDLYAEKPLCITVAECNALVSAVQQSRSIVQVGFQRRYDPRIAEGVGRVHAGDLGEVIELRAAFQASFGPLRGWFSKRARSGDWMIEQAVHYFDLMNWVLRTLPVSAYGRGRQDIFTAGEPDRDVSDYYSALIEYPGNVIVNWLHTWLCPARGVFDGNRMQVLGRTAGIDFEEAAVEYFDRERADEKLRAPTGDLARLAQEAFIECVKTRKQPFSNVYNGRDATLVGLLVRQAVYDRRVVTMEEVLRG